MRDGQDIRFEEKGGQEVGVKQEVVVIFLWADEIAPLWLIN
jgi:hypothetical protein